MSQLDVGLRKQTQLEYGFSFAPESQPGIMDELKLCLQAALKKYHEENHTLPDRIFEF